MPSLFDAGNIWKTLSEIDLGAIRTEAERGPWLALVGEDETTKSNLSQALHNDPRRALPAGDASQVGPHSLNLGVNEAARDLSADLNVLLLDATEEDFSKERELFQHWRAAKKPIVVVCASARNPDYGAWPEATVLRGALNDRAFLENEFVPAVLARLPERQLALARYYPLFRLRAARQLIADTSMANASYALTTGLAEIIPILNVPFNVADLIVLTKAQAIMAYKLGLMLGLSARWQDHMAAFGSTVGTGFLWRQLARQLIGLVPVWGIIPKVAVAYAGTYVLGEAIWQWYATDRQVTPAMMRQFYRDAFTQGKTLAQSLLQRAPRPPKRLRLPARTKIAKVVCANCGHANPGEFNYCGHCGAILSQA